MTSINATSRNKSGVQNPVNRLVCRALISATLCLTCLAGCKPTREEIDATIWLNNSPLPEALCGDELSTPRSELWNYGFYRRLNDGRLEFISFCDPQAAKWLGIIDTDFKNLLDKYVPEKRRAKYERQMRK